jgi:glutamate 5-kinase
VLDPTELDGIEIGSAGSAVGTGGMVTKVEAASIAASAGIPTLLTSAALVREGLAGEDVGTWFAGRDAPSASRLLWLAHAAQPNGRLFLDDGAVAAVVDRRTSLLPAGVTRIEGRFTAGDPVDLVDPAGRVVARGLVNFDAAELPALLGRSTRDLAAEKGAGYEREVVHRDDLALAPTGRGRVPRTSQGGSRGRRAAAATVPKA